MSGELICGGCRCAITNQRFLLCGGCGKHYDLECANFTDKRYNEITWEERNAWRCLLCKSSLPKTDNTNTPVRTDGVTLQRGAAGRGSVQLDMSIAEQPLSLMSLNDTAHNVTVEMTDLQSLVVELRSFREEMRDELRANRSQIQTLNDTLTSLVSRVAVCENRIDTLDDRIGALERRIETTGNEGSVSAAIDNLKAELNDRDQDLLLNEVEVSCISEQKGEGLQHIFVTLAHKLGVTLAEQDLVSVARVGRALESTESGSSSWPRPIVVRLARRAVRDQLLQAARVRRGATTEGLGVPGAPRRFYVNERLTKANRQLFRQARELGTRHNWRFVWTRDGRIFARQHHGNDAPRFRLRTEADLIRVFGPNAVRSSNDG